MRAVLIVGAIVPIIVALQSEGLVRAIANLIAFSLIVALLFYVGTRGKQVP